MAFANPHSLSQDAEVITRSEIARRAGVTFVDDEESRSLQHDLDNMLRDTWADALARISSLPKPKKHPKESRNNEVGQLAFRLVSSMKFPQHISLDPKPPTHNLTRSREPDYEDGEVQAEVRRMRAQSVAVEFGNLGEVAVSSRQAEPKPVKVRFANTLQSLPPLLVTEEVRATERIKARHSQASGSSAPSPHEPRLSCTVLPVVSVPEARRKQKRRKPMKERPPPGYWRPQPDVRGKSLGYALGYPSNWAPDRMYVRDAMKRGVES